MGPVSETHGSAGAGLPESATTGAPAPTEPAGGRVRNEDAEHEKPGECFRAPAVQASDSSGKLRQHFDRNHAHHRPARQLARCLDRPEKRLLDQRHRASDQFRHLAGRWLAATASPAVAPGVGANLMTNVPKYKGVASTRRARYR